MPKRLLFFRPPDLPQADDPLEQRRYRAKLAMWQTRIAVAVTVLCIGVAVAITPLGFARASDIQSKIDAAVKPLEQKVANIEAIQARDSKRLATSLANGIASEIRFIQSKRCKLLDPAERESMWREIERKQEEYTELLGHKYEMLKCEDL